jgi:hypothetical protein
LELEEMDQGTIGIANCGRSCLVGKLVADRIIRKDAIKSTLIRGWKPTGMTVFKVLGDNLFWWNLNMCGKSRVLEGRHWVFEGDLFSVEDFNGTIKPMKMEFENASFWIHMFHLPLACMSETMGVQIGSSVVLVEEVEIEEDGIGWSEYLRVRIRLDLSKPLARGRVLKLNGEPSWIAFQYERLPKFCFQCGVIHHGVTGCLGRQRSSSQEVNCIVSDLSLSSAKGIFLNFSF